MCKNKFLLKLKLGMKLKKFSEASGTQMSLHLNGQIIKEFLLL